MSLTVQYFKNRKARSLGYESGGHGFRYLLLLAIDALVVFSVVMMVSLIADIHGIKNRTTLNLANYRSENLGYSGMAKLNVGELETPPTLPTNSDLRYWLGPKHGYVYSIKSDIPGELTVKYILSGQSDAHPKEQTLSITAYENEMFYNRSVNALNSARPFSFSNANGDVLTVDASNFNAVKVALKGLAKIVMIHYPTLVNIETVLRDTAALTTIPVQDGTN